MFMDHDKHNTIDLLLINLSVMFAQIPILQLGYTVWQLLIIWFLLVEYIHQLWHSFSKQNIMYVRVMLKIKFKTPPISDFRLVDNIDFGLDQLSPRLFLFAL
jgi:hypothetical protein